MRRLPRNPRQDLTPAIINPQHPGSPIEPDPFQVPEQPVHGGSVVPNGPPHRVADPHDPLRDIPAGERHFYVHAHSPRRYGL